MFTTSNLILQLDIIIWTKVWCNKLVIPSCKSRLLVTASTVFCSVFCCQFLFYSSRHGTCKNYIKLFASTISQQSMNPPADLAVVVWKCHMSNISAMILTWVDSWDHNFRNPWDFAFPSREASGFSIVSLNTARQASKLLKTAFIKLCRCSANLTSWCDGNATTLLCSAANKLLVFY